MAHCGSERTVGSRTGAGGEPEGASFAFIFNPAADKGRAASKAAALEHGIGRLGNASFEATRYPGHAEEIARRVACKGTTIVACGGDGTLNEVVNAVAGLPVRVAVLPVGSANDFVKTLPALLRPDALHPAVLSQASGRSVDAGLVEFGDGRSRHFINSIGIGFTGRIAAAVKSSAWLKGELSYALALLRVLLGYAPLNMHITIDSPDGAVVVNEPVFAFSVSNGAVEGGKFRIAPDADPGDGLLDVCILKAIPGWMFGGYVLKYLSGTQIDDPRVIYCKASAVELFMPVADAMHMDGEVVGSVSGRIRVSAVPGAVEVLCQP